MGSYHITRQEMQEKRPKSTTPSSTAVRSMPLEHLERCQCGQWTCPDSFKVHLGSPWVRVVGRAVSEGVRA